MRRWKSLYEVLKVQNRKSTIVDYQLYGNLNVYIGDWSNGMIGVSKTFGGSSILSSPALAKLVNFEKSRFMSFFIFQKRPCYVNM